LIFAQQRDLIFDNKLGEKKVHEETEGKWSVKDSKIFLEPLRKKKTEKAPWAGFTLDQPWELEFKDGSIYNGNIKYEKKI